MQELEAWRVAHQEAQHLRQLITLAGHADTAHLVAEPLDELHQRLHAALQAAQAALDGASRSLRGRAP